MVSAVIRPPVGRIRGALAALLVLIALGAARAEPPRFQEERVSYPLDGRRIVGVLTRPVGRAPAQVVLVLPGAGGERDGPPIRGGGVGLLERTARLWAESGVASLRISPRGRGGSEGDFRDLTIGRRVDEAAAALRWLLDQEGYGALRIAVLGHSQGAVVAAHLAARAAPDRPLDAVMLWAPIADPRAGYRAVLGLKAYENALAADPVAIVRWRGASGAPRTARAAFFQELETLDVAAAVAAFAGPMLAVSGRSDRLSTLADARALLARHSGRHDAVIVEAGHWLGGAGLAAADETARRTLAWLQAQ